MDTFFDMDSTSIFFCFVSLVLLPFSSALHITSQTIDNFLLTEYDYVVVGGGVSGLVVANRLSEDSNRTVLVIESGELDRRESYVVAPGYIGLPHPSPYGQNVATAPQNFLDGKTRSIGQGRGIGGGSVMNGMCWTRGAAADFDAWEELGNPGWGWEGLLPYFKKVENYTVNVDENLRNRLNIHPNMLFHGTQGPINVAYPRHFYNSSYHVLQGFSEIGLHLSGDLNTGDPTGAMIVPSSMSPTNQTRSDARTGYFDSAISRSNLHVVTGQTATRLIVGLPVSSAEGDQRRIVGVDFSSGLFGINKTVTSSREVILAAGAIQSPTLLQVSGIGPRQVLESLNISVQIDLPGVGNNFQDHPMAHFPFDCEHRNVFLESQNVQLTSGPDANSYLFTSRDLTGASFEDALKTFLTNHSGPLTAPLVNTVAFPSLLWHGDEGEALRNITSQSSFEFIPLDTPPTVKAGYAEQKRLVLSHLARADVSAYELLTTSWGQVSVAAQKPLSRGTVRPSSASVFDGPLLDPRYCADPFDCKIIRLGLKTTRRLMHTEAMRPLLPITDARFNGNDDGMLMTALKPLVGTEYHPSGTTSMMPRELGGVVDARLTVYGTCNLRVVDAGVMPLIPGAHIQAAVYAVAEKAADIIKNTTSGPEACPLGVPKWPPV
ncbi:Oxygen-dependent choline dehydrogenase [Colletotrichum tanaceti]|uniref:Oxygen-dependent choline dehydrogenase n=1 Tax=Colletotrichum tanaceti TaxID=1306861 RepID=A0A4U6XAX7_9PEZI|nr:Oxygen-dependent choline dehydrogenase [Colletotrichum tanaceti]TKW52838.1 Oxygen-dependent choline dehydrogenase [Colletotrichum tanaceti]